MSKRILVPLDGTAVAQQALPHAVALAERFQAELILVRILEPPPGSVHLSAAAARLSESLTDALAREYLWHVAMRVHQRGIPVQVTTIRGRPHAEIVRFAEKAKVDLIVMCTRGHSGIRRWLLGSVTDRVVRDASVPVLVVHTSKEKAHQRITLPARFKQAEAHYHRARLEKHA